MRKSVTILALAGLAALTTACSTNTKGSWACSSPSGSSCAPISTIDNSTESGAASQVARVEGAAPVRWWEPQPFVFSNGEGSRREGDQVMRVVFAPWVDAQGDLHNRSEVQAVMRRGGWWMPSPTTVDASEQLRRIGRNAVEQ